MSPKNLMIAAAVVGSFVVATSGGCSDDDDAAAEGFHCPAVGEKNCPNDPGATQATVDACKQCETANRKYEECLGGRPKCAADGTSESIDLTKCSPELKALIGCVQGGSTSSSSGGTGSSDAGDAGGGGG